MTETELVIHSELEPENLIFRYRARTSVVVENYTVYRRYSKASMSGQKRVWVVRYGVSRNHAIKRARIAAERILGEDRAFTHERDRKQDSRQITKVKV